MRSLLSTLLLLLIPLSLVGATSHARADDDPWFGPDKGKHFGASAVIAAGGYGIGSLVFEDRVHSLFLGGGVALTAGVGKEVLDSMGYGQASARDLVWDVIGTAVGLGLALALDLAISSGSGSPKISHRSGCTELLIRF
ncbi:MAG: hypothetical protein FWD57_10455 [Polyangiaceae bacterium]|nr:hypothetical protein [Polyangiaceae bacterium]